MLSALESLGTNITNGDNVKCSRDKGLSPEPKPDDKADRDTDKRFDSVL